jgi:hypothetical protein
MKTYAALILLLLLVAGLCLGCQKQEPLTIDEPQVPAVGESWVMFSLRPAEASRENAKRYQATYVAEGKTARFDIELTMARPSGQLPVAFTKGKFIAVRDSDASALLLVLKKTLPAKTLPSGTLRVAELPFAAVILGDHVSHSPNGGFAVNPPGNWTSIKLFLGGGSSEVYLDLNTALGKGEFSSKDPEYGDGVLRELAKVL